MRKILFTTTAMLVVVATTWGTFSIQQALGEPTAAMDIASVHRNTETVLLPTAPVADYHAP